MTNYDEIEQAVLSGKVLARKFHSCVKIAQDIVFKKEMGFHKDQPKKSRISDSGRLRALVPLEGEYFLWNQ
jgi:hypothetical protein